MCLCILFAGGLPLKSNVVLELIFGRVHIVFSHLMKVMCRCCSLHAK